MQMDEEKIVVCERHGTHTHDGVRYLPTEYAKQYNQCLDCAIDIKALEHADSGNSGALFSQREIGMLIGEHTGNVYQIERKAMLNLVRKSKLFPKIGEFIAHIIKRVNLSEISHEVPQVEDPDVVYGLSEYDNEVHDDIDSLCPWHHQPAKDSS